MSQCYYVDPSLGQDSNSGLSPEAPKKDYRAVSLLPGDTLLFKRGTVTRDFLLLTDGDSGNPITYGAYGDGDAPTFLGSADLSGESAWKHEGGNLWSYAGVLPSEACNLIFAGNIGFGFDQHRRFGGLIIIQTGAPMEPADHVEIFHLLQITADCRFRNV